LGWQVDVRGGKVSGAFPLQQLMRIWLYPQLSIRDTMKIATITSDCALICFSSTLSLNPNSGFGD
jgi:hypothetical protein